MLLFSNISIVNENFDIMENMFVGVSEGKIIYVGNTEPDGDYAEKYDGNGKLLIPAFCNTHSHLPMSLLRGYGENLPLMEWLQGKIFPFEARLTSDDIYWGCKLGIAEMLRYGIASSTEMYINEDPECRAFVESEAKSNLSLACMSSEDVDYTDLQVYRDAIEAQEKYNGAGDGKLLTEFCLHAEYTSNERIARGIAGIARENNSSMHIHVSETAGEVEQCRERHQGRSPVQYLHDCGIFDVRTTAAHCVHIDEDDIELLKADGVSVASCPKSNLKLASGICPVYNLLESGVNVCIGTDSVASNNNLNMIEEMRFFSLLQKGSSGNPTAVSTKQALYCATRAGYLSQGREDCGLIKEGFKADLAVIDVNKVNMKPCHNLLNNLIYSASGNDVVLTMVDGKVLYRDGEYSTLDIEHIVYECQKAADRIAGELN